MLGVTVVFICITLTSAQTYEDHILYKLDDGPRFQYLQDDRGEPFMVDLWVNISYLSESRRYNPDTQNTYNLFTRKNPTMRYTLLPNRRDLLDKSPFKRFKRTVVIVHGWRTNWQSAVNTVLVPAFLAAADMNVIVVDWSAGAGTKNYPVAAMNAVRSGKGIARFISWLNAASGSKIVLYHLVGFSLGAHAVGVAGRNLGGRVPYITALDPAGPGFGLINKNRFNENDGIYTEVIHTNAGMAGYLRPLGKVDFYPNGGSFMPGCDSGSIEETLSCNHGRSHRYLAESLSSTFTGHQCMSYIFAFIGQCYLRSMHMGGLLPKIGQRGIYYLETNASPPYSKG